ncbi:Acyltransferase domain protein [Minicystis rosea]|nr:Acyltransferase domain protein [Minicystis rosea]
MVATAVDASAAAPANVPSAPEDTLTRSALVWLFRRIIGVYFREIEVTGNLPQPDTGGRIFVSNHTNALVDPILVLTTAPARIVPVAKATLWKITGLRWLLDQAGAVPIQRRRDDPNKQAGANEEIFDKVAAALSDGRNILIFPEGVSHNEPRLVEMKTGAARMLARAHARGARGLTFQAVALEFDQRNVFRSRSLLIYGPVRSVDEIGLEGDALVAAITARVRADLEELLVEGATWPERLLIARVAEMLTNDTGERSLEGWNSIGRQVEAARMALRDVDESTVQAIAEAVDQYYARLDEEGLADEQLASGDLRAVRTLEDAALWLSLPLAVAGTALYAVPFYVTRFAAERIAAETDELSTYKLGVGLLAYPLWAAGLMGAGWLVLPAPLAAGWSGVVLTSPFAALAWHDAMPRVRRAVRFATRKERLRALRELRAAAMAKIEAARLKVGM